MKLKRIGILSIACLMLALTVVGNATANTAWPGTHDDKSSITSGTATYSDFITDRLYITVSDTGVWHNYLTVYGSTGYYPEASWSLTDGSGGSGSVYSTVLYSNNNVFIRDGGQQITRAGSYQNGVCHLYDTTPHGYGPNTGTRGMVYTAS